MRVLKVPSVPCSRSALARGWSGDDAIVVTNEGHCEATYVGMFDYVRCRYPLPHHQDAQFQTKDLLSLVDRGEWLGGLLDNYEITKDGRLRRQRHKYKVVKTPRRFPSVHLKSIKSWWATVPDAHGDVLIYTSDDTENKRGHRWIEFRIRFTNGRVQDVEDRSRASLIEPKRRAHSQPTRAKPASGARPAAGHRGRSTRR